MAMVAGQNVAAYLEPWAIVGEWMPSRKLYAVVEIGVYKH
jgi:hypothetical protein